MVDRMRTSFVAVCGNLFYNCFLAWLTFHILRGIAVSGGYMQFIHFRNGSGNIILKTVVKSQANQPLAKAGVLIRAYVVVVGLHPAVLIQEKENRNCFYVRWNW